MKRLDGQLFEPQDDGEQVYVRIHSVIKYCVKISREISLLFSSFYLEGKRSVKLMVAGFCVAYLLGLIPLTSILADKFIVPFW